MGLFDKKAFDNLIDGDKKLFVELLHLYATDYPQIIMGLKSAIVKSDLKQIEILAHRIRGMVRNFFASGLADEAEDIEDGGREGTLTDADAKVDALAVKLKQLEEELAQHLGSYA